MSPTTSPRLCDIAPHCHSLLLQSPYYSHIPVLDFAHAAPTAQRLFVLFFIQRIPTNLFKSSSNARGT